MRDGVPLIPVRLSRLSNLYYCKSLGMEGGLSHSHRIPFLFQEQCDMFWPTMCGVMSKFYYHLTFPLRMNRVVFCGSFSSHYRSMGLTLNLLDLLLGVSLCPTVSHVHSPVFSMPSCSWGHQTPVSNSVLVLLYGTSLCT